MTKIKINMYLNQDLLGSYSFTEFSMSINTYKRGLFGNWIPWRDAKVVLKWSYRGSLTYGTAIGNNNSVFGIGKINYNSVGSFTINKNPNSIYQVWHPISSASTMWYGPRFFKASVLSPNLLPTLFSSTFTGEASGTVKFKSRFRSASLTYP